MTALPRELPGPINVEEAAAARDHLEQADPRLAPIVKAKGLVNPYLWPDVPLHHGDPLDGLAFHIVGQQISVKAAVVLFDKLRRELGGNITAEVLATSTPERIRVAGGVNGGKARALNELGQKIVSGEFSFEHLQALDDDAAQKELVGLRGIGPWTAAVFVQLEMQRPDVFPAGDLGLRIAVGRLDELIEPPSVKDTATRAEIWRPWRSYASMYLWEWRGAFDRAKVASAS
jgi:DNA-3-methyladenine glycosylase II